MIWAVRWAVKLVVKRRCQRGGVARLLVKERGVKGLLVVLRVAVAPSGGVRGGLVERGAESDAELKKMLGGEGGNGAAKPRRRSSKASDSE